MERASGSHAIRMPGILTADARRLRDRAIDS